MFKNKMHLTLTIEYFKRAWGHFSTMISIVFILFVEAMISRLNGGLFSNGKTCFMSSMKSLVNQLV